MGQNNLLDALAGALSVLPRSTLLLMSSLVSAVLAGLFDVWELRETELSEGDSRLALRRCCEGGCGETAGDRFFPLPSTRPPPRDLPEVMIEGVEGNVARSWVSKCRRGSLGTVKSSDQAR